MFEEGKKDARELLQRYREIGTEKEPNPNDCFMWMENKGGSPWKALPIYTLFETIFPEYELIKDEDSSWSELKKALLVNKVPILRYMRSERELLAKVIAWIIWTKKENRSSAKVFNAEYFPGFLLAFFLPDKKEIDDEVLVCYKNALNYGSLHTEDTKEMVFNWLAATFEISEKWVKKAYKLGMFEIPKVTEEDLEKSRKKDAFWIRSMRDAEKSLRADAENRRAEHNSGLNSEAANRIVW